MANAETRISKIDGQIKAIMARPTYSSTPAWQQEVAELRRSIEQLKTGVKVPRHGFERATIHPTIASEGGAVVAAEVEAGEEHGHDHSQYMKIFLYLTLLTLAELGWVEICKGNSLILGLGLSAMAIVKALMVALYYMHLKMEQRTMYYILALPAVLVVILISLLLPDAFEALKRAAFSVG